MASIKFSISLDAYESKKHNFTVNTWKFSDWCSIYSIPGYVHLTVASTVKPFSKLKHIRVSQLNTELSDVTESDQCESSPNYSNKDSDQESPLSQNANFYQEFQKGRQNIWKRFRGVRKVIKDVNREHKSRENDNNHKKQQNLEFTNGEDSMGDNVIEAELGAFRSDLSLERCNSILKQLEKGSETKALQFFEWMRKNGKLKQNVTAFNLALRVLGRREDWHMAEAILREMADLGCVLNFQVFNTLIYACHKRGLVELGKKWFHMMLDNGVRPNIATFGMVMSLYQKGSSVEEAEFAFSKMRSLKLKCESAYSAMITVYTRLGLYDKAEDVTGYLREDGIILNSENWLVLLNTYSQQGKLEEAEQVLVSMQESGFSPSIVAYNTLITGYGKVSNMVEAQRLFWNLKNVGLEPDETTYRSMIEGWGRAKNYKEAKWFYSELKKSGYKPNSSNLYTMINLQAKHEDEEGAVRTIHDMMTIGCQYSSALGILLQAYERAGRLNKVPFVLKGSFYKHILNNQTSCSILVMSYVKHGLVNDVIEVLRDKQWKDLVFEDNLYHLLICTCKELGHLENAVKIYSHMPKFEDKPNLHIASTMIDIYSAMSLFTAAENLYLSLRSSDIALDLIAFSVTVRLYVKAGSLKDACGVLDTMEKQKNIVPDIYLIRDMLRIYQQSGMLDKLSNMYYKILKTGVTWDQEMYNCVINCCSHALPVDELSRLFDEMLHRGFSPNTITFNVMLDVYGKSRLFKKARRVFWMARKRGLVDVISFNTLIASYGKSKDLKRMSSTVKKMQFSGYTVSLEAYNCLLDAYGKEGQMEKFRGVLQRMRESDCTSDNYTYNILINIYGEQGWIEEVSDILMELKESGVGPDLCGYNTLIKAYGIAGMVEDAVALVKEMRKNRIEPDRVTYCNLITALQKNDMVLEAVKWSLWMKQMGLGGL